MAESTLTLGYDDLAAEVGYFLGFGRTSGNWTADQLAQVDAVVQAGYRQFVVPPPVGGIAHRWSFLRPTMSLVTWQSLAVAAGETITGTLASGVVTITRSAGTRTFQPSMVGHSIVVTDVGTLPIIEYVSSTVIKATGAAAIAAPKTWAVTYDGTGDYRLPDDFGAIDSEITFLDISVGYSTLILTSEARIRERRQAASSTGRPVEAAVIPLAHDPTIGQRFTMQFWPKPASVYTVRFRYTPMLGKLSSSNKYPVGGMAHSNTVLESCLAVAEQKHTDQTGVHQQEFQRNLAASILHDQQSMGPHNLGMNRDRSDDPRGVRPRGDTCVYTPGV